MIKRILLILAAAALSCAASDSRWKCLFLESPALWNSVSERAHNEKWIVIILPDAAPAQIGKTMNSRFLAAYDDAVERFRINKERIFLAGRVPSAIFAVLRPVAGIVLQESDFRGLEKAVPDLNFLRRNPNLRAYVLLGNRDLANVDYQAQFIISRIPKNFVGIYQGNTSILQKQLADQALDWIKKETGLQ